MRFVSYLLSSACLCASVVSSSLRPCEASERIRGPPGPGLTTSTVLDGFTIKLGNADMVNSLTQGYGGGLFVHGNSGSGSNPQIIDYKFTDNDA